MAVAFGIGALVLLPALLATQPTWLLHTDGIALALFLGIVPTALAYLLFASGLRRLTAAETSTLTLAEPLTAAVLGAVVLAEPLSGPRSPAPCSCSPVWSCSPSPAGGRVASPEPAGIGVMAAPVRCTACRPSTPWPTRCGARSSTARCGRRRLRERELCETYGVARHSLRAALRTLATEGLVTIEPHRGAQRRPAHARRRPLAVRAARRPRARGRAPRARAQRRPPAGRRAPRARGLRPPARATPAVERDQRGPRRAPRRDRPRGAQPAHRGLPRGAERRDAAVPARAASRTCPPTQLAADHRALIEASSARGRPFCASTCARPPRRWPVRGTDRAGDRGSAARPAVCGGGERRPGGRALPS